MFGTQYKNLLKIYYQGFAGRKAGARMFTRGIFRRISSSAARPDVTVDVLVGKIAFSSVKYADWFEDCANRVCRYQYGSMVACSLASLCGNGANYHGLAVPLNHHVSIACNEIVPGAQSIDYSYLYSDDMFSILALTSAVQVPSVHDVRHRLGEIVSMVCGCDERTYGNGC